MASCGGRSLRTSICHIVAPLLQMPRSRRCRWPRRHTWDGKTREHCDDRAFSSAESPSMCFSCSCWGSFVFLKLCQQHTGVHCAFLFFLCLSRRGLLRYQGRPLSLCKRPAGGRPTVIKDDAKACRPKALSQAPETFSSHWCGYCGRIGCLGGVEGRKARRVRVV